MSGNRRELALAAGAVLVAMVSIQAGAALAKRLFPVLGPMGTSGLRIALAAVMLCAVFRPWRGTLSPAQHRLVVAYGLVLGAMNLVFYLAVARVPLGIVVAIEFCGPLGVAVLSSRRAADMAWAALAALGILLFLPVTKDAPALDPLGLLFAATAGVGWGSYIVIGQKLGPVPAGLSTSVGMLVAAALVVPIALAEAGPALFAPAVLPVGLLVAVLSSALPYTLEMVALRHLPAKTFGIFMSLEPALAALAGFIVLGERLTAVQVLATACVIAASLGSAAGMRAPSTVAEPA